MFTLLKRETTFPNDVALFYMSEVCLVLEHLHAQKIIYRDLKTENILIDHDGHIKLTDFGFAKQIYDKTYTVCGTPVFCAPEIIMEYGHDHTVDWWTFGILLYYVLTGYYPFWDSDPEKLYQGILGGYYEFPKEIQDPAKDFIKCLL